MAIDNTDDRVVTYNSIFQDIAVAIQSKDNGGKMYDTQMAGRIEAIPDGSKIVDKTVVSFSNNAITSIGSYGFYSCRQLLSIICDNVISIGLSAFQDCTRLTDINFPKAETLESNAFRSCSSLTTATFNSALSLANTVFAGCTRLKRLYFPKVTSIGSQCFYICSNLTAVILGDRATLSSSTNMPANIVFYVQEDDFTWYQNETNWSALYAEGKVKSINDLPS